MRDHFWPFVEKGKHWNYSDVASWRLGLKTPWPSDPTAELFEVLRNGQVPLIGIPVQPNVLWPKERQEAWKEWAGRGPKRDGHPMPTRIPPGYLAEVDLRVSVEGVAAELWWSAAELWWNCGLLAWRCVYFARDELIRAYMAYLDLELPPVAAPAEAPGGDPAPAPAHPPTAAPVDTPIMKPLLPEKKLGEFLRPRPPAKTETDHADAQAAFPDYSVPRDRLVVPVRIELGRHRARGRPPKSPGGFTDC